ncbi:hypothetical protein GCK32_015246 [Trichostrongylus colubriformis]|uniref:Uncharacterized protein n=1 Tax=Trichostrongylus colubriformis TaxID=6319 RepID=A0AAN8FP93_TRICO
MFYACLAIMILFIIICSCVTLAIIDLELYNFGLYIVLLCIVGTMLVCALCVATPHACPDPEWYTKFCILMHEMYPDTEHDGHSPKMGGLRARMQQHARNHGIQSDEAGQRQPLREPRATVAMLAPAVHIMHQVWRGMAWVTEGIEDEEEETRSSDKMEQGMDAYVTTAMKRLSVIPEASSCPREMDLQTEDSDEINSMNDVSL